MLAFGKKGFVRLGGLALLAVLLFLTVQPVSAHGGGGMGGMHTTTVPYDVQFMQQMIPHHYSAVIMTEMCVNRGAHSSLRELCAHMKSVQSAEIKMMQGWLLSWYGIRQAVSVDMMGQRMIDRLKPLSGSAFDRAFLQEMIRHHQMAVMMGNKCVQSARHAELRSLCGSIVTSQTAEIRQMRGWLCEWYKECTTTGGCH